MNAARTYIKFLKRTDIVFGMSDWNLDIRGTFIYVVINPTKNIKIRKIR